MNKISISAFWLSILFSSATAVRPFLGLPIGDLLFLLGLIFSVADLVSIGLNSLRNGSVVYFTGALLVVCAALMSGWAYVRPESIYLQTLKIGFTFLIYIPILSWVATNPAVVAKFRTAWIYAGALAGLSAVMQKLNIGFLPGIETFWGRMTGLTEHPNELGLVTAIILPMALQKLLCETGKLNAVINAVLLMTIIAGLVLSLSMTGMICAIVGIGLWLLLAVSNKRTRGKATITVCAVVCISLPLSFLLRDTINDFQDRVQFTVGGDQQTTVDSRISGIQELLVDNNGLRLTGRGVNAVLDAEGNAIHNMYLRAAVELGLIGMIGIVILTVYIGWLAVKDLLKQGAEPGDAYGGALLVCYAVFLLGAQAGPVMNQRDVWISAMLILAMRAPRAAHLRRLPDQFRRHFKEVIPSKGKVPFGLR